MSLPCNGILQEYNSIIVSSFYKTDLKNHNEILFSVHSCGLEGNWFSVDKTMLEAFEILDHFKAYSYILENKNNSLNEKILKSVHRILTQNTISYKGYIPREYSKTQMTAGDTIFRDTKKAIKNMSKLLDSFEQALIEKKYT